MLINNHHLHVEEHGPKNGHPLVFLHHGLGSTRSWRKQVPVLVKAGYRVIVYDRWGYGKSESRPDLNPPGFEEDLTDLHVLLETCDLPLVTLIGHSDGGTIALYYAAQNPGRVLALVTVSAHIYLESKMEPGIQNIRATFEKDEEFRSKFQRAHGDKFESVFHNWFDGWHTPKTLAWDMRPLLSGIACPTLVVQGEADEHATFQHAHDTAESIPGAELWFVPSAMHMLPQDLPEVFNQKLLEFLSVTCQITE
jgi:pimeloyl-ACP methyl ester carboxylesterase